VRKSVLACLEWPGMEEVSFGLTGIAWTGANWFLPNWNGLEWKSQFWLDWSGLEWRKSVLSCIEWPGIKEVIFGLTGIAWNGGS
jgi:hypothetical protein